MFIVNGKPFFSIGGQLHNSTSYVASDMHKGFGAVKKIGGNTIAVPIMWETIEPIEGQFDFSQLHAIVEMARQYELKLTILWFGSWKNGMSHYVPQWVKRDKQRFQFVMTSHGKTIRNMSMCSQANMQADIRAYGELVTEIERINTDETIIALQVQNEPGIIGCDRDYSPLAQKLFDAKVPTDMIELTRKLPESAFGADFVKCGSKTINWQSAYGTYAGEYFTAYYLSKYVDAVAGKAKTITKLPLYTNVWLQDMYWQLPGANYPSGGATAKVLDIWKTFATNLDWISPDNYLPHTSGFENVIKQYARQDNLLYVPESAPIGSNAHNMFTALKHGKLIGYHIFGVDSMVSNATGELLPFATDLVRSLTIMKNCVPFIQNPVGKTHVVVQEEYATCEVLDFDEFRVILTYDSGKDMLGNDFVNPVPKDTFHNFFDPADPSNMCAKRGRGIINYQGNGVFYVVGCGFGVIIQRIDTIENMTSNIMSNSFMATRHVDYLEIVEGNFDADNNFVVSRQRNGDETDGGGWLSEDIGVLRITMDN